MTFSSPVVPDALFESHVVRTDKQGTAVESEGTFAGVVVGAAQRSDGTYLVAYSRPADEREAAGATRLFTRILTPVSGRSHAARH